MEVAPSGEKRGVQTDPGMGAVSPGEMPPGDRSYSYAVEWIKNVAEADTDPVMPPAYIVRFPDACPFEISCADAVSVSYLTFLDGPSLGWERLVAYNSIEVEWCDYKNYLVDYFTRNASQVPILCAKQKPETVGEGVAAANLCIKLERKLLKHCRDYLTREDILLSKDIKKHAKHLIGSDGLSSVATAGMVCIAKEADLILKLPTVKSDWDATLMIDFGNQIRQSVLKLMRFKDSKSADAVAGAMLGLAIEAQLVEGYLTSENPCVSEKYEMSHEIRKCTAELLTKLEDLLARETADDEETRKKSEKRKNSEETLHKKMKLNGGNEKLHTGATVAVTEEIEAEGQLGREEFSEDLTVFVDNLPFSVDCNQLMGLFKQAGSVKTAKVIYDKPTGRSRGFGFVTMSSVSEVKAAVEQFHGHVLDGKSLRVNPSGNPSLQRRPRGDANKVFVGNLSWSVDKLALTKLFREQGEVLEANIICDRERRSRGFGFVTYGSAAEVENAISNLDGTNLEGRKIHVKVADSKPPMLQY